MEPELVVRTRAEVGEGPIWDPGTATLVWVDITGSAVHRFDPATGRDACMGTWGLTWARWRCGRVAGW